MQVTAPAVVLPARLGLARQAALVVGACSSPRRRSAPFHNDGLAPGDTYDALHTAAA